MDCEARGRFEIGIERGHLRAGLLPRHPGTKRESNKKEKVKKKKGTRNSG
jgi:hypothetical protein